MYDHSSKRSTGVLIVDDCPDTSSSMAFLARAWGHKAHTAATGKAALALAAEHRPAVVLLDIGLPDMTGHELARRLRQLPGMADAFIAAISGYSQPTDLARSTEAGCQMHLVKPVDLDLVRRLLAERDHGGGALPPLTPETLASGLDDLFSAAMVVEAIDDPDRRGALGWDVSGWRYEPIPWGVRFLRGAAGDEKAVAWTVALAPDAVVSSQPFRR